MKVVVIMHAESEGPGTLREFLESRHARIHIVRLHAGDRFPGEREGFGAVVTMGGPMNVYEEDKYPFLRDETIFLQRAISSGVPILGICLGAQMIAKACGAPVRKAPISELGWNDVCLTDAGRYDGLFQGLPETLRVFQWHEDTFEVPSGGSLLAISKQCPHQAFRYGNAYGLQFHVEVTREMLIEWFEASGERRAIMREFDETGDILLHNARRMYANFLALAKNLVRS